MKNEAEKIDNTQGNGVLPYVSTSTVIYTEQDMIDCFTAGVKFARNMMENPSNTEYMMLVNEQKLSAK